MLSIAPNRASRSLLARLSVERRLPGYSPTSRIPKSGLSIYNFVAGSALRCSSTTSTPQTAFASRLQEVQAAVPDPYPRLENHPGRINIADFRSRYDYLESDQVVEDTVVVQGRIRSYRLAGSKLIFFDIIQNGSKLQAMCNLRQLADITPAKFKQFYRLLRRGDSFSVIGQPHRTGRGELTIQVTELPKMLSPTLHDVPVDTKEHGTSAFPRHVQYLADKRTWDVLRLRSAIIQHVRQFFIDRAFMEVNTPIIAGEAGGATARPFVTTANEFPDKQLSLRIAPELWLKRLVVGGFDKVFEIGSSFRNEGIDKSHNPEFMTCEFYQAYANLEDIMSLTENFLSGLALNVQQHKERIESDISNPDVDFSSPYRRIDFLPDIETAIGRSLPNLSASTAEEDIKALFTELSIPLPDLPTLPRLMDKLCATYLEPQCQNPTFITNPPECLSPLSKSFVHPSCSQKVAARCELFIKGSEYVNAYEEENSPWEQRRKFQDQVAYNVHTHEWGEVDESYLQALEWGLPPTGGWGCGIERLVMLFTDSKRIEDVLPFGTLRTVSRRFDAPPSDHS